MSGGRWDYGRALEDNQEALQRLTATNEVMTTVEHEMDWGYSGDTCRECSKLRALAALEQFFDDRCGSAAASVAIARDHRQNRCSKCLKRVEESFELPTLPQAVDELILDWMADNKVFEGISSVPDDVHVYASREEKRRMSKKLAYRVGFRKMILAAMAVEETDAERTSK